MSKPIQELALLISELPGIGPKQARRIVQFFLGKDNSFRNKFAVLVKEIRERTSQCKICFRYDDAKTNGTCSICSDQDRDTHQLMVVEKDVDIESVENSGAYTGRYFVLGGLIPMTQRKNAPYVRVSELLDRIKKNSVEEIILALSTTPEGDFTSRELLAEMRERLPTSENLRVSLLGRGLSVGAEIEYADGETLRQALRTRQRSQSEGSKTQ